MTIAKRRGVDQFRGVPPLISSCRYCLLARKRCVLRPRRSRSRGRRRAAADVRLLPSGVNMDGECTLTLKLVGGLTTRGARARI